MPNNNQMKESPMNLRTFTALGLALLVPSALNAMEPQQSLKELCVSICLTEFISAERTTIVNKHLRGFYDSSLNRVCYPKTLKQAFPTTSSYQAQVGFTEKFHNDNNTIVINWNFSKIGSQSVVIIEDKPQRLTIGADPFTLLTYRDEKSTARATLTVAATWKENTIDNQNDAQ